jgi:hypothetical protein
LQGHILWTDVVNDHLVLAVVFKGEEVYLCGSDNGLTVTKLIGVEAGGGSAFRTLSVVFVDWDFEVSYGRSTVEASVTRLANGGTVIVRLVDSIY